MARSSEQRTRRVALTRRLPRRGPMRAMLKRVYYSPPLRYALLGPLDAVERLLGRRPPMVPPRRLRHDGGRGDVSEVGRRWLRYLGERRALQPDSDVLEIGCGTGRVAAALTAALDERGSYEGFDVVPRAIRWCQEAITPRHPQFRFQVVDIHSGQYNPRGGAAASDLEFPFADRSFDYALALSVFSHMAPDGMRNYIAEAARVLRDGGSLVASFFLLDEAARERLGRGETDFALDHRLTDRSGAPYWVSDRRVPEHNVGHRREDVLAALEQAGLELEDSIPGWWAGHPRNAESFYQDVIAARKPPAPG